MQFPNDGMGVGRIVDLDVAHRHTASAQPDREAAHGRENQRDLLLVAPDVGRLVIDLGHEDEVVHRVDIPKGREVVG